MLNASRHRLAFWWDQVRGVEPRIDIAWRRSDIVQCGQGDGAWFVHAPSVARGGICYSFGIGHDISFDRDVTDRFGLKVHAFDPTPIAQAWLAKQQVPAGFHSHALGLGASDGTTQFTLPRSHEISFTPLGHIDGKATVTAEIRRLSTLRELLGHANTPITVLKMDIEGGEYDVIPDLAADSRLTQVLIEFHHRLSPRGIAATSDAVAQLRKGGFLPVYRSARGLEYTFIRE